MPPTILPYVQAVKRAPVAKTPLPTPDSGSGSTDLSGRSTEESTLTSCATLRPGSASGLGRRTASNASTAPQADSTTSLPIVSDPCL
jgi:hypothetical protein